MKTKIFSAIALMLCVGFFSSCDYDDDKLMAPDCGNTEVNGNEGVYFGNYEMEYSVSGSTDKEQYEATVVMFVTNLGNDDMKFEVFRMSYINCHWYVSGKITEFTQHLWYDNDKIVGQNVSIRGALAQFAHVYSAPKKVGDIAIYYEKFYGFKQANAFMREEFNPAGQYAGKYYETVLFVDNDDEFERISNAINTGQNPSELDWIEWDGALINVSLSGSARQAVGETTFNTNASVSVELFLGSAGYPGCYRSMWKGTKSISSNGSTWEAQKDATSFDVKGAVVSQDGKILLPKTYTVKKNADGEGGTISGIWFEGTKVPEGQETEIVLEPEE